MPENSPAWYFLWKLEAIRRSAIALRDIQYYTCMIYNNLTLLLLQRIYLFIIYGL